MPVDSLQTSNITGNENNKALCEFLFNPALTRRINKNTHMNIRLRLTAVAAVFAFLPPTPSALHARMLAHGHRKAQWYANVLSR